MDPIRAKIEADIATETKRARISSIFRRYQERKATPAPAAPVRIPANGISTETPDEPGEGSDGFDFLHAGNANYFDLCARQTGTVIPDEAFEESQKRRAAQDAATVETAKALDATGRFPDRKFYLGENDPSRCTVITLFSRSAKPLPPVRRLNVLPSIAAQNRSKILCDVERFLAEHPQTARMFTITNGPRVPIDANLRGEVSRFHRWLSRMAAHPLLKRYGLVMQWRATEFGTPKWDPEHLKITLHLHAHCLMTEPDSMSGKRRGKLRKKLWRLFGVRWDDAGTIANAREFVKYPLKDQDRDLILKEGGAGLLMDFIQAIRGLHTVQPMGQLRSDRKARKAAALRAYRDTGADGPFVNVGPDWNAGKRPLAKVNDRRKRYIEQSRALAARMACADYSRLIGSAATDAAIETDSIKAVSTDGDRLPSPESGDERRQTERERSAPRIANRVIARLAPAPFATPICEPAVVVWGFDGNLDAVLSQPRVAAIIAAHRTAWQDAVEARALIRACAHEQARALAANQSSQRSNNCPRDLGELALADAENRPPGYEDARFRT